MREMRYRATEEKVIFFDLPHTKGLRIKGILRGELAGPLAIMMHGRPGNGNELLQYLGARYLCERGISTLRLFMYDFEPKTRNLMDSSLQTHADDFEAVVQDLREQNVTKVFAIGHSYGGLTILKSKIELNAAVLWDPSHGLWWTENRDSLFTDEYPEVVVDKYVIGTAGSGWAYPVAARESDQQLGDTSSWAAKNYPLKVISAGNGALIDLGKRYIEEAREPRSHTVIANAHHSFDDSDDVMLELFEETYDWITKTLPSQ
jgi:dienelactone hydrolase